MKTKLLGIIVLAVMVAAVVLSGCAPAPAPKPTPAPAPAPAPAKVYEWKMQSFCPTGMERYQVDIATQLPKMVSDATNGQIKITAYPAGALVPVPDMLSATRDNVIQMTHSVGSHWAGVIPVGNVEFSMPMAYQTCEDAWTVMWDRGLQDLLEKPYNEKGVHYLGHEGDDGHCLQSA